MYVCVSVCVCVSCVCVYVCVCTLWDLLRCLPASLSAAAAAHTHSPREREERDELVNRDAHQDPVGPGKKNCRLYVMPQKPMLLRCLVRTRHWTLVG